MGIEIRERSLSSANSSGDGRLLSLVPPSLESERIPFRPFQIVSLLEMLQKYAQGFFRMGEIMAQIRMASEIAVTSAFKETQNKQVEGDPLARINENLDYLEQWCDILKLDLSVKGIRWAREQINAKPAYRTLSQTIPEVQRRVFDQLDSVWFLDLPVGATNYYENSQLFGEEVLNKVGNVATDIGEAGSCFATGRFTACVFHLMRIMERGTQELGNKLGVQLTEEKNWHNILEEVNKAIRRLNPQTPEDKQVRDNYSAASAHLHNVKEAWRNRVMHPKQTYTQEEAKAVFDNVKTFMVHLATYVL